MKKQRTLIILILIIITILTIPVFAFDESELIGDISEYIPDAVSEQINDVESFNVNYVVKFILEILIVLIKPVMKNFAILLGIIILISAFAQIKTSLASEAIATVFDYVGLLCIALAVYNIMFNLWKDVREVLDCITIIIDAMIPTMAILYTAGGNVATAVTNNANLLMIMALLENVCYYGLYPILQICFGVSLAASVSGSVNLSGISSFIRNTYLFILMFIMALLSAVMSFQTNIALATDSVAARSLKFTMSSTIPIVGGAVGEAVRAISGGIGYIKSTVGILGVFAILIIIIPVLLNLLLNKFGINLISVIAKIIGCEKESAFLNDIMSLINYVIAMLASCSIFFIFTLTLFIQSATAFG